MNHTFLQLKKIISQNGWSTVDLSNVEHDQFFLGLNDVQMQWNHIISVGSGAAIGGILRYYLTMGIKMETSKFPWATLFINLTGSFILGLLISYFSKYEASTSFKLLLTTGFCGGFTTFSAFSMELVLMLQRGLYISSGVYIVTSVLGGLLLAWIGYRALM